MTSARYLRFGVLTLILVAATATAVSAQTEGRFALGVGAASRLATGNAVRGIDSAGIIWRIGHSKPGWRPTVGLNWFAVDLGESPGGSSIELGEVKVKPLMVGYGYTRIIGRAALSANVLAGYSLASVRLSDDASDVFTAKVHGDAVVNPELNLWFDISRKIGLNLNANYMISRPRLTLTTAFGSATDRLRADMVMFKAGLVYSIF